MRLIDLTGERFGRLTVLKRAKKNMRGKPAWVCECDCGNVTIVHGNSLRQCLTRSCGCLRKEMMCDNNPGLGYCGSDNPNWRGGTSRQGYDERFTEEFKRSIRKRDLYCCQVCGMTQKENWQELSVHHIDYDRQNSVPENCVSLCCSCHSKTNGNRRYWYSKLRRD